MKSSEYRELVRKVCRAAIRTNVPRLQPGVKKKLIDDIAAMVHAKLYGAEVDGVVSPAFRDMWQDITAPQQTPDELFTESESDEQTTGARRRATNAGKRVVSGNKG